LQYFDKPKIPVLRGKEAIEALYEYIDELKEQRDKELTKRQIRVLTKVAKGLITSIETETKNQENIRQSQLLSGLTNSIERYIFQTFKELAQGISPNQTTSSYSPQPPPAVNQQLR